MYIIKQIGSARMNKFLKIMATILCIVVGIASVTALGIVMFRKTDKIDLPFVNDTNVIGKWTSVDLVKNMDDFNPSKVSSGTEFYFNKVEFLENGKLKFNDDSPGSWFVWTKGFVIQKQDKTASEYIIKDINGKQYMFFEWKSGDYIYLHKKPYYYVLQKNN